MMKRRLAGFQFDGDRPELLPLLLTQGRFDCAHVIGESGNRQKIPAVASRNVMNTTVLARRIVETNPAREMRHRLGASPVRIVLMPGDYSTVVRGFAEQLIVPKADRAAQQLR